MKLFPSKSISDAHEDAVLYYESHSTLGDKNVMYEFFRSSAEFSGHACLDFLILREFNQRQSKLAS